MRTTTRAAFLAVVLATACFDTTDAGGAAAAVVADAAVDAVAAEAGVDADAVSAADATADAIEVHSGPHLVVIPSPIEFLCAKIGTVRRLDVLLRSDGEGPVTVTGITLDDASAAFSIDFSSLSTGKAPTVDSPLVIPAAADELVVASYTPLADNPFDPITQQYVPDSAVLSVQSDSFDSPLLVSLTGRSVCGSCATPVIVIEEGEQVMPQTVLHLHGDQSQAAAGSIISYQWTVTQPQGNNFALEPSASYPNPTHELNVAGEYTYCLDVCDAQHCSNEAGCATTVCRKVVVCPCGSAIHVELTWDTPGDLDQTDTGPDAGADLDLHFLDPRAIGPTLEGDGVGPIWFDPTYDTFWANPHPDWTDANGNAKPTLDRDDTDGWGPENVDANPPAAKTQYRVGVHYWDDHGYGLSYARLKVYVWGQLVYDKDLKDLGQKLFKCDLWDAVTIDWPTGAVKSVQNGDGSLRVSHDGSGLACNHGLTKPAATL